MFDSLFRLIDQIRKKNMDRKNKLDEITRKLVEAGVPERYARALGRYVLDGYITLDTALSLGKELEKEKSEKIKEKLSRL